MYISNLKLLGPGAKSTNYLLEPLNNRSFHCVIRVVFHDSSVLGR